MEGRQMIISIGRQCGSGGHEIGEKLAEHYGIKLYDRNLVMLLAERTNQDPDKLAKLDERVTGRLFPIRKDGFSAEGNLMSKMTPSDLLYLQEKSLIEQLAETESFVIIGRAANVILQSHPNTLRMYIYASEEFKIPRVKEFYHLDTDKDAIKQMRRIDKFRQDYFHYYSNAVWGSSDAHDFTIDSSIFGIDDTVDIIMEIAKRKFK